MKGRAVVILTWFLLIALNMLSNADSCLTVSEQNWRTVSDKTDFIETYNEKEPSDKKTKSSSFSKPTADLDGLKYVFYFIIAGFIIFILVKIASGYRNDRVAPVNTDSVQYSLEQVEEQIMEIDLNAILEQALQNQDYKLALRINFLMIIKLLAAKGKINWTKEKTNWDYYEELRAETFVNDYRKITQTFELIWYGDHTLNAGQYNGLIVSYEQFKNQFNAA